MPRTARNLRRAALLLTGLAVVGGGLAPSAQAALRDTVGPAYSGTYQLTGGGWGHGHGLSQYGAQGAARRGQTAAQILDFYYPGTASTQIVSDTIRVRLSALVGSPVAVSAAPGLRVTSAAGQALTLPAGPSRWRLTRSSTGTAFSLDSLTGSTWTHVTTLAGTSTFSGPAQLSVWSGGYPRAYDGSVTTYSYLGTQNTNVTTSIESYVAGVIPYEMGGSFPAAALQAQAVAARSYGWYQRGSRRAQGLPYDVWDSTSDQVYRGPSGRTSTTDAATAATALTVRTYAGHVIFAQFGSSDGGWTARGGQAYLAPRADPWERFSSNPYETWTGTMSVSSIRSWTGLSTVSGVHVNRDTSSGGHVTSVVFSGTRGGASASVSESGDAVRLHYGLRSTYFAVLPPPSAVAGDLTGSGRTGPAVWRPANGTFYRLGGSTTVYGQSGDVPVPADYLGAGHNQLAVFRPSTGQWYVQGYPPVRWGQAGDVPVPGDYLGTGRVQLAVFRPSTGQWWVAGRGPVTYGQAGDIPVPGDYTGAGRTQLAVFRPATGTWYVLGRPGVLFGQTGDVPVPGDYAGVGRDQVAVFRPATGTWYVQGHVGVAYGRAGDMPVPGDFLGTGKQTPAVYRPTSGTWFVLGRPGVVFGGPAHVPLATPAPLRITSS